MRSHTDFIVGHGAATSASNWARLFELITLAAGIVTTVALYPVLKRQSEGLALGYVTVRVVESALIAVGIVSLLPVVTLRQDLAGATGTDNAPLILNGRSLIAVHDATFLLGPAFCAAIGNGHIRGYLMFRSRLVPRRFALFGIVSGSLALITAILVLFGAYDQVSGPSGILTAPEAPMGAVARHLPHRQGFPTGCPALRTRPTQHRSSRRPRLPTGRRRVTRPGKTG